MFVLFCFPCGSKEKACLFFWFGCLVLADQETNAEVSSFFYCFFFFREVGRRRRLGREKLRKGSAAAVNGPRDRADTLLIVGAGVVKRPRNILGGLFFVPSWHSLPRARRNLYWHDRCLTSAATRRWRT